MFPPQATPTQTKRPSVSSFLADKADARKTRQIVDKMESTHDHRKQEFNLIPAADNSWPEDDFGPIEPVVKGVKR